DSFSKLAARSRSMHKSQGFGNFAGFGGGGGGGRPESFTLLDGEPATKDILDGVDTSWARYGAEEIGKLADNGIAKFDQANPAASVPALLDLRAKLAGVAKDPVVEEKKQLLDRITQSCMGLTVLTTTGQSAVVPGETLQLHHVVTLKSAVPVKWVQ